MDKTLAKQTLEQFCSLPLCSSREVMLKFAALPRAIVHLDNAKKSFVYVPGTRSDRVLLAAHADTVWDSFYTDQTFTQALTEETGIYRGTNPLCGIGADDRAGCAILWLLRNSGHSLLILDGEEHGQIGAHQIEERYPEIFEELNRHAYAIQFDRRNDRDYKVYNLPVSDEFLAHVESSTGYTDAGRNARTDIVVLCRKICGVNLSVGYHDEHTAAEHLVFDEWFHTLELAEAFLAEPQRQYPLLRQE